MITSSIIGEQQTSYRGDVHFAWEATACSVPSRQQCLSDKNNQQPAELSLSDRLLPNWDNSELVVLAICIENILYYIIIYYYYIFYNFIVASCQ